jgi:cytochrome bd-type quinol oxidase subunit 2
METYLPVIWAAIIGLAVAMYVILDGFDLGIGILFPFAETDRERDQMMNSVAPFWDGNETWLVLGGAGMMVAFRWLIRSFCRRFICRSSSCCSRWCSAGSHSSSDGSG